MDVASRINLADLTAVLANAESSVAAWTEGVVGGAAAAKAAHGRAVAELEGEDCMRASAVPELQGASLRAHALRTWGSKRGVEARGAERGSACGGDRIERFCSSSHAFSPLPTHLPSQARRRPGPPGRRQRGGGGFAET